jgi:hypothetical protein
MANPAPKKSKLTRSWMARRRDADGWGMISAASGCFLDEGWVGANSSGLILFLFD